MASSSASSMTTSASHCYRIRPVKKSTFQLIDNSRNLYIPIRLGCGVVLQCRPEVLAHCSAVLQDLNDDIQQCLRILPESVRPLIKRTRVWVNMIYYYGRSDRPSVLNHTTAHHHESWLILARDRPEKALGIEIYSCFDYRKMRLHWNGCGLIMHEFCHLIHQQVLGLDCRAVFDAFHHAQQSKLYDNVLRRDWAGKNEDHDLAYAMVDHKEFFAEMSVAYWSRSYVELDDASSDQILKCSPPFHEKNVLARAHDRWPSLVKVDASTLSSISAPAQKRSSIMWWFKAAREWIVSQFSFRFPIQNTRTNFLEHCNKFYPFTCGQLQKYDPELYATLQRLWLHIAEWRDPLYKDPRDCCKFWCLPSPDRPKSILLSDTVDL